MLSDDGRVLLVKRRHEPLAGQWSLPGGMLELGETLEAGIAREMQEETGLVVTVGPVVEAFDRILLDDTGRVRYHFVLVDYLCRVRGGTLRAGVGCRSGRVRRSARARAVPIDGQERRRDRQSRVVGRRGFAPAELPRRARSSDSPPIKGA